MNFQIILVNGPPGSGKDTIAKEFIRRGLPYDVIGKYQVSPIEEKFSYPLKAAIPALFDLDPLEAVDLEDNKNDPSPTLFGVSYRKAQIDMSENYVKSTFGDKTFGKLAVRRIQKTLSRFGTNLLIPVFVISDSGFDSEADAVEEAFPGRVSIVRLVRDGTSFVNDSRKYIKFKPQGGLSMWLENNESKDQLWRSFRGFVQSVLENWERQHNV